MISRRLTLYGSTYRYTHPLGGQMAITDDVQRLTRELWRLNQLLGFGQRLGYDSWDDAGGNMGRVAKAAGASPETVQAWMRGDVVPTTQQALAVLDALPLPAPLELASQNGNRP